MAQQKKHIHTDKNRSVSLKREVTLLFLIFYGLGNILGAGIYVLISEVAGVAGFFTPISFAVACIVVLFTALSYAELSARYPLSAGEAIYTKYGFNSIKLSVAVGLTISFSGTLSAATIVHGFNGYVSLFTDLPSYIVAFLLIATLCAIAILGIGKSVKIASLLTLFEIFGLLLVIYVGAGFLLDKDIALIPTKSHEIHNFIPPLEGDIWQGIFLGAFLAFFAFIGFEDMVNIAEEVKEPTKTMPKAIITALIIASTLYICVAVISILVIPPDLLSGSSAPLADVYQQATDEKPILLSLIGMFAVINGALIQIVMVSRIFYGMSNQGWFPKPFKSIHPKTRTPIFATIVASALVLFFTYWLPIVTLAQLTSFFIFIVFTIINLALINIKKKDPNPQGILTFPIWVPITAIIVNIIMLSFQTYSFMTKVLL